MQPIKVAVLGGGVGGLTAAFELTRPEHRGRFEVTVYQLGWRLGGKGASGRNAGRGNRIEEHGLHIWFGFYANAFRMMREVYEELDRPPGSPLSSVAAAFAPCPNIALLDRIAGEWRAVTGRFPRRGDHPWCDDEADSPNAIELAGRALRWGIESIDAVPGTEAPVARQRLVEAEAITHQEGIVEELLEQIVEKVGEARDALLSAWAERLNTDPRLRLIYTTVDAFLAAAVGILADGVLQDGFGAIDGREWREWLEDHGASDLTVAESFLDCAPMLRSVYDVAFAFPGGDVESANAAAGTATKDLLKLALTYRGHLGYKMTAGMGDAIFAPLYEVLDRRGVDFRFFHAVTGLHPSADGSQVETIEVLPQVERDLDYEPLVDVNGLPCWPHLPIPDRVPASVRPLGRRLETEHDPLGRRPHATVKLRRGEEFHHAVLAIPVGAHEEIGAPLMKANRRFAEMVKAAQTVQTQAFQLWTRRPPEDLGAEHLGDTVAATFVEPLDTYCDMRQTLAAEDWGPGDDVRGIAYVCGVLPECPPEQADAQVRRNMEAYVECDLPHLWPGAEDPGAEVADRYWRANVASWERYVLTPAGSVEHRLRADRSGFENLVLAGDWTDTGINGGCVEAAVMSGLRAARSLSGDTTTIPGEDGWLST
jgi:uncharacterized protein with NAD-binding domain and iron-sulfur cluster